MRKQTGVRHQPTRHIRFIFSLVVLGGLLFLQVQNALAQIGTVQFSGTLYWSASMQMTQQSGLPDLSYPEIASRLDLAYERQFPDYMVRLRGDARGTWGARPNFNQERDLTGSLRILEASVTTLSRAGEWTIGRQPVLLPHGPDDFRRFGLLAGNPSHNVDGLSWYRPLGHWQLEAALAMIHVLRNPTTGQLDRGDLWFAIRAASQRATENGLFAYAPTLLISDAVDSFGWSLPMRFDTGGHRLEGEIAQYNLTGTTLVPTGWYSAAVLRYAPLRASSIPLESIEVASIPANFLPYLGNFGDRGGRLNWRPGEAGVAARFATDIGAWEIAWRQIQSFESTPWDAWELSWSPPVLPQPLSTASVSLVRARDTWQLGLRLGAGYRF